MHELLVSFAPQAGAAADEEAREGAIYDLLGAWLTTGQALDRDTIVATTTAGYGMTVACPEADSLDARWDDARVARAKERLADAGLAQPTAQPVGAACGGGVCACAAPTTYVLFTHFLSMAPPLSCGACNEAVPLYRIGGLEERQRQGARRWQASYRACDTLYIGSSVLEMAALRQLSRHDSVLSDEGRAICASVERAGGVPTYYYLLRPRGRSRAGELRRRCPSCGGAWRLDQGRSVFHFQCDACRLVSNIAWDIG